MSEKRSLARGNFVSENEVKNTHSPTIEQVKNGYTPGTPELPELPDNLVTTDDLDNLVTLEISPIKSQLVSINNDLSTRATITWVLEQIRTITGIDVPDLTNYVTKNDLSKYSLVDHTHINTSRMIVNGEYVEIGNNEQNNYVRIKYRKNNQGYYRLITFGEQGMVSGLSSNGNRYFTIDDDGIANFKGYLLNGIDINTLYARKNDIVDMATISWVSDQLQNITNPSPTTPSEFLSYSFTESDHTLYARYNNNYGSIMIASRTDNNAVPTYTCIGAFGYPFSVALPGDMNGTPPTVSSLKLFTVDQSGTIDVLSGYSIAGTDIKNIFATKEELQNIEHLACKTVDATEHVYASLISAHNLLTSPIINGYNAPLVTDEDITTRSQVESLVVTHSDNSTHIGDALHFHDTTGTIQASFELTKSTYYGSHHPLKTKSIDVEYINDCYVPHGYPDEVLPLEMFIPVVKYDSVMEIGKYIDFHSTANTDYDVRLMCDGNKLILKSRGGTTTNLNTTVTHNAPINEDLCSFQLGAPVFTTGSIYHYDPMTHTYVSGTGGGFTDCIPSVKTTGSYRQYLGICVGIHEAGCKLYVGDTVKSEVEIQQPTITFASHGDYLFRVNDSSQYQVGDIVLFDGNKLDDDLIITSKIQQSIVGKVSGIVDEHLLAIFKD